jgi:hypothetical protein
MHKSSRCCDERRMTVLFLARTRVIPKVISNVA